jgi:hypothetical protein
LEGQSGLALARNLMTHPDAIGVIFYFITAAMRSCL